MPDREKVIAALTACARGSVTCKQSGCPLWGEEDDCIGKMARDALELLKAQQKTPVVFKQYDGSIESECGNCGLYLDKTYSVCPKCGKVLNWND